MCEACDVDRAQERGGRRERREERSEERGGIREQSKEQTSAAGAFRLVREEKNRVAKGNKGIGNAGSMHATPKHARGP